MMMNVNRKRAARLAWLVVAAVPALAGKFTIEQVLGAPFSYELVSARKADRIAWLQFEEGKRNVYTAAAPGFEPARLTSFLNDDGEDLSGLRISDDGGVVVFVRGHNPNREDWVANPSSLSDGAEQAIWAAPTRGGAPFRVVAGREPELSPDGRLVVFVRNGQIYQSAVRPAASSGTRGVARAKQDESLEPLFRAWGRNSRPRFSPDGRRIAFASDRGDHSFVAVYDRVSRRIAHLAPSVDYDSNPAWSADGARVVFLRRPGAPFQRILALGLGRAAGGPPRAFILPPGREAPEDRRSDLPPGFADSKLPGGGSISFWVADPASGQGSEVWRSPAGDSSYESVRELSWAAGRLVFDVERNNWRHRYSVPSEGDPNSAPVNLTPGEGEAEMAAISPDGAYLYYSSNAGDIDRRHLWKTPVSGGAPVPLTSGEGIETYPAVLASGKQIAVLYAGPRHPQLPALVPAEGGAARVISKPPSAFPMTDHVAPQQVILTAPDGLKFHCQLFLPPDLKPGERRPAILFSHGGPMRQMLLGYQYMFFYHMAYGVNQYFANQGYVVISVNYRSGIGYGRNFRMAENRGARGSSEYQDIYAAGKYLGERPDVDPKKIGLWGLSYGGLLTALGLSRNSDLFAAGVDIAGVHLWGTSLDPGNTAFRASSVATIDRWKSPVLLVHGDDDRNVHFSQTTGLVQLLRARQIHHELIVYPDEVHDFLVHSKWLKTFHAADAFFNRFLVKAAGPPLP